MPAFTGWCIDRDYLAEPGDATRVGYGQLALELVQAEAVQIWGRRITIETGLRSVDVADAVRFRLLDDDGEIYYGGAISRGWIDGDEVTAFAPLKFGEADAGCTELQYRYSTDDDWCTL